MRRRHLLLWLWPVVLSGCMLSNASPKKKLATSVQDLNDDARWGRIASAATRVDPTYRDKFLSTHSRWGESVQVADTEVIQIDFSDDQEMATAMVAYSWYAQNQMTLQQTLVRQRWMRMEESNTFGLISEAVVNGDMSLFLPDTSPKHAPVAAENVSVSMMGDEK